MTQELLLLPQRGLDQSILLPVLIGLIVLAITTEMFGWVFVGLVVPGYLGSVIAIHPASGATIIVESVVTYAVVRALSDIFSRSGAWNMLFGRDRFFVIVVVSIAIRQSSHVWGIPLVEHGLTRAFGAPIVTPGELTSIGLVLVPLTANMFWKTGFQRGAAQVGIATAATWAVVALVLLPYTNLSLSEMEVTYESVALDFEGGAKAYVIVVCGALLGARFNLKYGWDYNGIMVPALLSLTWLAPAKLVSTLAETLTLVALTRAALSAPGLRTANLEGPRKIVLVFVLGFVLKYALAWTLGDRLPSYKITDFFGFGYLLPSLIAVKIVQKKVTARVILPTLITSFLAFVVGSAVTLVGNRILPAAGEEEVLRQPPSLEPLARSDASVLAVAGERTQVSLEGVERPQLAQAARQIARHLEAGEELSPALFDTHQLPDGTTAHVPKVVGAPTLLVHPELAGPVLALPRPRSESATMDGAGWVCRVLACRAVLVSGVDEGHVPPGPGSSFRAATAGLTSTPTIELRVAAGEISRAYLRARYPTGLDARELDANIVLGWTPPDGGTEWIEGSGAMVVALAEGVLTPREKADPPSGSIRERIARAQSAPASARSEAPDPYVRRVLIRLVRQLVEEVATANAGDSLPSIAKLRAVGFDASSVSCPSGRNSCLFVSSQTVAGGGMADLTSLIVRRGQRHPAVVVVSHPRTEPGTLDAGLALFQALDAAALLVGDDRFVDAEEFALFAAQMGALQAVAGEDEATVLRVRGLASWRENPDPVTVALDRPALRGLAVPQALSADARLPRVLAALFGPVRVAGGEQDAIGLFERELRVKRVAARLGLPPVTTIWLAHSVRARLRPAQLEPHLRAHARTGSSLAMVPLDQLLTGPLPELATTSPEQVADVRADIIREATTSDPHLRRALAGVRAETHGMSLRFGWDEGHGRRYTALDSTSAGVRERWIYLGPGPVCDTFDTAEERMGAVMGRCGTLLRRQELTP